MRERPVPDGSAEPVSFSRLLQIAKPYRWRMLCSIGLGFGTIASGIGLMGTSAFLISAASLQPSIAELQVAIVSVRFFGISRGVLRYAERLMSHDTTLRLLGGLRVWFYERLEPLAPARVMEYRSGDLLSRAVHDIDVLEDLYVRVLSPTLVALGIGIFTGFFLGRWDPLFAIVFWLFYGFAALVLPWTSSHFTENAAKARIEDRSEMDATILEYLHGLADLMVYDQVDSWQIRIKELSEAYEHSLENITRITGFSDALLNFTQNVATAAMMFIAIPAVAEGKLDGVLLAVILLVTIASYEAILPLPTSAHQWHSSIQAAERLFEIIDAQPTVIDPTHPELIVEPSTMQFQELEFYYPQTTHAALRDLTFQANSGQALAIVGRSGAGKTTVANLLLRFWEYQKGRVTLGDSEIKNFSQKDLRQAISMVEQDGYLFEGTILYNLLLANPLASKSRIHDALQASQSLDFITSLPEGLDTWIGEFGFGLSGGEVRRLILARSLLQDKSILILDEPTADLDPITANKLTQSLQLLSKSKVSIWITHRLVGLESMDEIVVLDKGKIIDRGSFPELIKNEGAFFKQWSQQVDVHLLDSMSTPHPG